MLQGSGYGAKLCLGLDYGCGCCRAGTEWVADGRADWTSNCESGSDAVNSCGCL